MDSRSLKTIVAMSLGLGMMAVAAPGVSSHDAECELRLRDAPIEAVTLPVGWEWDFFRLEQHGAPSFQASIDASGRAVNLELSCISDPEALFDRLEELRVVAGNDKLSVIEIGDESMATREFSDFPTIRWRHGDIIGLVRGDDDVDYGDMEAFAVGVDERLP